MISYDLVSFPVYIGSVKCQRFDDDFGGYSYQTFVELSITENRKLQTLKFVTDVKYVLRENRGVIWMQNPNKKVRS